MRLADAALYQAKEQGRNGTVVHEDDPPETAAPVDHAPASVSPGL